MTEMTCVTTKVPSRVLEAITTLWEAQFRTEVQAINSGRFRMLCHMCSSVYPEFPGSRLPIPPTSDFDRGQFPAALRRFFRWIGAPWHPAGPCLSPERAAERLHAAFLAPRVKRTHLVPLDRLALEDNTNTPPEDLKHLCFEGSEIILLEEAEFAEYVPVDALKRFEPRHWFEPEKYAGFYYLLLSEVE